MLIKSLLALAVGGVAAWQLTAPKRLRPGTQESGNGRKLVAENTWETKAAPCVGPARSWDPLPNCRELLWTTVLMSA